MVLDLGGDDHLFVGRTRELEDLASPSATVVSVCGISGVGKSRLVKEAISHRLQGSPAEIAWLDVSNGLTAPSLEIAVARSIGTESLEPFDVRLATRARRILLVIDGADRLLGEIELILTGLAGYPDLGVIVTSIRPVKGPLVHRVDLGGLELPADGWDPEKDPEKYEATELFAAVAGSHLRDFQVSGEFLREAGRVCRALDGIPAAIVLAAARLSRPLGAHGRLSRHIQDDPAFGLELRSTDRSRARHTTVRDSLRNTYSTLDPTEKRVWQCTSVFEGPFGIRAAEEVCDLPRYTLIGPLEELAGLRLLEPDSACVDQPAFRLTPLSRAFARNVLAKSSEMADVEMRHAVHFLDEARKSSDNYDDRTGDVEHSLLDSEPDLYRALDHLVGEGRTDLALSMVGYMGHVALVSGHVSELLPYMDRLLADGIGDLEQDAAARALLWAATLGRQSLASRETLEITERRWNEGMALARNADNSLLVLRGLAGAILALPVTLDFAQVVAAVDEGSRISREIGHPQWLARFTLWSGMVAHQKGELEEAARLAEEALGFALRADDQSTLTLVGVLVTSMTPDKAPDLRSLPSLEDLLVIAEGLQDKECIGHLLSHLTVRSLELKDFASAAAYMNRRLDMFRSSRLWYGIGMSLLAAVQLAYGLGNYELAALIHGALLPNLPTLTAGTGSRDRQRREQMVADLETQLGADLFDTLIRRGGQQSYIEVLEALTPLLADPFEGSARSTNGSKTAAVPVLTPRETEVLRSLVEGLTNKEIASRLGISHKTVMHHTMAVYRKLGVRGRAEAAVTALRSGLVVPDLI